MKGFQPNASLAILALILLMGCFGVDDKQKPVFVDESEKRGLDFRHKNGAEGKYYMPEIMGAGGALFDFDGDGDLDVFFSQGHSLDHGPGGNNQGGRLYRNDDNGHGNFKFVDVTESSGIDARDYGMGAAVGDMNNDGLPDLYLANFGNNKLYLNRGNGRFEDVTEKSGTDDARWSVSAVFFDYDRDGFLDLFIVNYVNFSMSNHKDCYFAHLDYCHPNSYSPEPDRLLRNLGDGRFEDVTGQSRIATAFGNGLGVACADFNNDGWLDIYVANDANANQCWINQGDGTFTDTALLSGSALNHSGFAESGMGVDAGDFDNDGDEDLFVTHLTGQTNTLYRNDGTGIFDDATNALGLAASSHGATGFGTAWIDFDNDGLLDLLATNGMVTARQDLPGDSFPYHQEDQLFHNRGTSFELHASSGLTLSEVGRGALFGDIDNDGGQDVVICNNNGPVRLMMNRVGAKNNWIGIEAFNDKRHAIGAKVSLTNGTQTFNRRITRGGSYASANDPRIVLGLGAEPVSNVTVQVTWNDGSKESFANLSAGKYHKIRKGQGTSL